MNKFNEWQLFIIRSLRAGTPTPKTPASQSKFLMEFFAIDSDGDFLSDGSEFGYECDKLISLAIEMADSNIMAMPLDTDRCIKWLHELSGVEIEMRDCNGDDIERVRDAVKNFIRRGKGRDVYISKISDYMKKQKYFKLVASQSPDILNAIMSGMVESGEIQISVSGKLVRWTVKK